MPYAVGTSDDLDDQQLERVFLALVRETWRSQFWTHNNNAGSLRQVSVDRAKQQAAWVQTVLQTVALVEASEEKAGQSDVEGTVHIPCVITVNDRVLSSTSMTHWRRRQRKRRENAEKTV